MRTLCCLALLSVACIGQTPFITAGTVQVSYEIGGTLAVPVTVVGIERTQSAPGGGALLSGSCHVAIVVGVCAHTGQVQAGSIVNGVRTYTVSFTCQGRKITVSWTTGHPLADAYSTTYSYQHPQWGHGFGANVW